MIDNVIYKKCHGCGVEYPRTSEFFYKDKRTKAKDGLKYTCKKCCESRRSYHKKPHKWESETKKCYYCKNDLPRTKEYFYMDYRRIDGLSSICRKCNGTRGMEWAIKNPDKKRKYRRTTIQNQWNTNINFRIALGLRNRIRNAIKRSDGEKALKSIDLLGAPIDVVKKHLESLFQEGMTWANHTIDGWHIDHIIPCAAFDLTKPEEQKKCFHYTNLQPLWARDNLVKNSNQ